MAHGITGLAETDTYGFFAKECATAGGLRIAGFHENHIGIFLCATNVTPNTTKTVEGVGTIRMVSAKKCGTGQAASGSDANLVSIGDYGTTRFLFDAEGSGHADVEWTTYSDNRLKFNQEVVPYGLDTLLQLQPKIYCKDSGYLTCGVPVLEGQRRRQIGFIAQEVMALMPETVKDICSDTSWYSLEDGKLTAVVVKAIQELNAKVSALEGK